MAAIEGDFGDMLNDELDEILKRTTVGSFMWQTVKGTVATQSLGTNLEEIYNFEIRDDDVVVCSFPKSGTTWLQEMVWCITNELDFKKAKSVDLEERFPYFEYSSLTPKGRLQKHGEIPKYMLDTLDYLKKSDCRRYLKTHLPLTLLPKKIQVADRKAKLLYVCRDPRDVCVSFYHHRQFLFNGSFEEYIKLFMGGRVLFGPYWNHVLPYWKSRHQQNMLFVTYEEMKKDLPAVIRRVAAFLDKTLTPEQVASLADHLSFESMKNNKAINGDLKEHGKLTSSFLRTGQTGGYLKDMTPEQIQEFDTWIKRGVEGTDFVIPNN